MNTRSLLLGAAAGSAVMFLLDPDGGRRRRALLRDQVTRASRKTRDGLDATSRDLSNRARGVAAATRARLSNEPVTDVTLVERTRAKLGRACSHPRAIDVYARDGEVTLCGPVLASEMTAVLSTAAAVPGVAAVHNELEPHDTADIPSLQGEGRRAGPSLDILQSNWAPATRALVGAGLVGSAVWIAARARHPVTVTEHGHGAM
jgi:BON domain